jgi:hypothetical protein
MRTVQLIDVPGPGTKVSDAEAIVVALKGRTTPAKSGNFGAPDFFLRAFEVLDGESANRLSVIPAKAAIQGPRGSDGRLGPPLSRG